MDLTPIFNDVLRQHGAGLAGPRVFQLRELDAFLEEAYRIHQRVAELHAYLRSVRQSYLSAAHPPRRRPLARTDSSASLAPGDKNAKYLTDQQRAQIDAEAKQLLRELNAAIFQLSDVEQKRQDAESVIAAKKRAKAGLGALGRWAGGGVGIPKTREEELEEARAKTVKTHRESVVWYLQKELEACGGFQSSMMEIRLTREVEKNKSILYKAQGSAAAAADMANSSHDAAGPSGAGDAAPSPGAAADRDAGGLAVEDVDSAEAEQRLSPEQLQLFARENQDMLKHYEDTLDKVRAAERSLVEISELQTTLATNLTTQSAHIDQLVADSFLTTENVQRGNRELRRASERGSTAKMIFRGTFVFCAFLILWDLVI